MQTTESAGVSTDPLAAAKSLRLREAWLLVATFLVAVAGLIYELIAATLSSYLLGDSVRQFSYVIGVFLSSMGLGAWLSRYVERPMAGFVWAQILLGIAGGFMAPAVFLTFAWMESVSLPLYGLLITVGLLSGLEIPLIARVLKDIGAPEFRFENVLSVDYIGALVASLAFPLLIIPHLGLMAGSLAFGALNLGVAGLSLWIFRRDTSRAQLGVWAIALLVTLVALWQAERLVSVTESNLFEDDIILSEATPYQQITVTRYRDRTRLFLDYSIQFDSLDEYRYHESLVHPAMSLYGLLITVGLLSGLEIPLIARVLKDIGAPEFRFENVLSVDYIGALVASLAFPLLIIPHLGLMAGSLAFGALNLGVAGLSLWIFRRDTSRAQLGVWAIALLVTLVALWQAERLVSVTESNLFEDDIILSEATPYQQITVTRYRDRTRLFLDYSIQFDSLDEYRYHESLVHPAMSLAPRRKSVLILGGGDGMAAREVLRWAGIETVTLVDLDPRVTELFRDHPDLSPLNHGSLSDPRLDIKNVDAWRFVEGSSAVYDVIIIDLPDPKNLALSKLYSRQFYGTLVERLSAQGVMVTQAGSPLFAREAFWSINATLQSSRNPQAPGAGLSTQPYHAYLPSFGDWGFVLASPQKPASTRLGLPAGLAAELKYLTPEVWQAAQVFDPQSGPTPVAVNTVQSHALVGYYLDGWARWFE